MNNNVRIILSNSKALIEKQNRVINEKLLSFNIFNICDITYDEVRICRFLSELLNPKGKHLQGIKYLKIFFKEVLRYEIVPTDDELNGAIVLREERIKDNRRIDISILIYINNERCYIPIEVKIYAGDQKAQCYDYYRYSLYMNNNKKETSYVYYLTIDGQYPSINSLIANDKFSGKVTGDGLHVKTSNDDTVIDCDEVKTLSWKRDILHWIDLCLSEVNDNSLTCEKTVLSQFRKTIDDFCGNRMNDQMDELIRNIAGSKDNFEAAKIISDCLQKAANQKLFEFYNLIYDHLKNDGWNKKKTFDDDIEDYGFRRSVWPTIYKDYVINGVICELAITTESGGAPFFGVSLKKYESKEKEATLVDFFKDKKLNKDYEGGWITWQYLPNDNEVPNFKYYNENFYKLFDVMQAKQIIDKCVDAIRGFEGNLDIK